MRLSEIMNFVESSLAETQESAGMLRNFAQICLQIIIYFPLIYVVQST